MCEGSCTPLGQGHRGVSSCRSRASRTRPTAQMDGMHSGLTQQLPSLTLMLEID